jgi:hypothetical protein
VYGTQFGGMIDLHFYNLISLCSQSGGVKDRHSQFFYYV